MSVEDRRSASGSDRTAELDFRLPLAGGLHARPASELAEAAGAFACEIELSGSRGQSANAKSVIALVALDVRSDEPCRLRFRGSDALAARAALERFVRETLPGCDTPLSAPPVEAELVLPRALVETGLRPVRGSPAAAGIGRGVLVHLKALALPEAGLLDAGGPPDVERARALGALTDLRAALAAELGLGQNAIAVGILRAHLALARDASLEDAVLRHVARGRAAPRAVWQAGEELAGILARSESQLVRERALDIEDVCLQLLERLCGERACARRITLDGPSVLLAERLGPRQFLDLERGHLQGLLLESGGVTSHTVILARSFGIPTLTGVNAVGELTAGARVVVDADLGIVLAEDDARVRRHYDGRVAAQERRRLSLAESATAPATTRDGRRIHVAANVSSAEELERVFAGGAEGIGLLRTEMLFLEREEAPSEEEQLAFLTTVLAAAGGRPVIVRALDVGGDKPLPWLGLPSEPNPFLGRRGVRLYPEMGAVIDTQLRAVLRASARGPLQLMLPMVTAPEEVVAVRERLAALRAELDAQGIPCGDSLPVGIMLEIPAAAFDLGALARQADFFSLGTNDLAQYFFAADRENERVSGLADPLHPAFLRFLRTIAGEARAHGRRLGLCGEMARDPACLPLLVGLGLDELSLAAPALPAVKRGIGLLDSSECRDLLSRACACEDARAVRALVDAFRPRGGALALCTPELIALDSAATTRAQVIQELVDLLHAAFRSEDPLAVERAIWAREDNWSTGLGGGIAVPHCKSDAVAATTLAVVRVKQPVDWDAVDQQPVHCALLLAVRETGDQREHMRTLAALARRLVDETFRDELLAAPDAAAVLACLARELDLHAPPA